MTTPGTWPSLRQPPLASTPCAPALPPPDALDLLGPPRLSDAQQPALIFHDRRITYQDLRSEVSRLASGLRENFPAGDLLAIWLPNCPELLCLYLACLKAGVVPMPLHQGMKWPEMREVLQYSRVKWLITSRVLADPHAADLTGMGLDRIYVIDPDPAPSLGPYQAYTDLTKKDPAAGHEPFPSERQPDGAADPGWPSSLCHPDTLQAALRDVSHEDTVAQVRSPEDCPEFRSPEGCPEFSRWRQPPEPIPQRMRPGGAPEPWSQQLALVLHTSGSNGHAKGVMLSRGNIEHILQYRLAHTHLTPDSISVVASCLTQSVGFYQSLALLAAGGTIVLLESYDIDQMVDCVNRHQPTHLIMVVDAFDRLLHHPAVTENSFSRLTFASAGADRLTSRVQTRFIAQTGRPLRVSYGLTESSWALTNSGDQVDKCLALGRPCPGIEVRLLGGDGREVPVGEVGEICIKSPRTMLGYLHDEELTRAAFADGWLLSGDLAYRDAEGWFWFAGRKKHLIVLSSGDNVSPLEVENVILSHPAVSNCAVVGIATPHGSEVPWALVTRLDELLSEAALEEFLRQRISDYKIPRKIVFLPQLPVGRSGKVHRDEAKKLLAQH